MLVYPGIPLPAWLSDSCLPVGHYVWLKLTVLVLPVQMAPPPAWTHEDDMSLPAPGCKLWWWPLLAGNSCWKILLTRIKCKNKPSRVESSRVVSSRGRGGAKWSVDTVSGFASWDGTWLGISLLLYVPHELFSGQICHSACPTVTV